MCQDLTQNPLHFPVLRLMLNCLYFSMLVGPEIECHTVEVQEGESLDGKCNVTGSPTPHIQWLINGHSINPGHSLRRNDTGTYEVKAEGLTSVEKKVQLIVFCECNSCMLNVFSKHFNHFVDNVFLV